MMDRLRSSGVAPIWLASTRIIVILLAITSGLAACVPIRSVSKIGLIAPFEGLYRRSGYEALSALRDAIEECSVPGHDVLPLALDDSNLPTAATRAAEKLRVDPAVTSVVGPISPQTVPGAAPVLQTYSPRWYIPFLVNPDGGFVEPMGDSAWAAQLLSAIANTAASQGSERLLVVTANGIWEVYRRDMEDLQLAIPILIYSTSTAMLAELQAADSVLWLGAPDAGAALLNRLRATEPDTPFWMGPQGADPVFTDLATITGPVYWAIWTDAAYNAWSESHVPSTPSAYLTYRAACSALAYAAGQPASSEAWRVQTFSLGPDGTSHPLSVE